MNAISPLRFDSLAGYCRSPASVLIAHELAWYEEANETLLGLVAQDVPDNDYVSYVLGRDAKGRFRAVWLECSITTQEEATEILRNKLAELAGSPPEDFYQGDEVGAPVDFFSPIVPADRRHPLFDTLFSQQAYSPARALIGEMMHYFEAVDGNFIQQFQSNGFDARIWELYLYALLNELGYGFDREHTSPDFHCQGLLGDFFIEATTVNPSEVPPEVDMSNRQAYFDHYVPTKYGGTLFSKLRRKYWTYPHVVGHPLVLAIQDFHAPHSMTWSNTGLVEYLYAIRQTHKVAADGKVEIISERLTEHRRRNKPPIPSGFFFQPETENISAVLANPTGTLTKFNRMGFLAGFGDRHITMICRGYCYKGSPVPEQFVAEVNSPDYTESWCDGVSIYHNPNARIALPAETFPCAAHHTSRDGRILSQQPPFQPLGSTTVIMVPS
jgi:hypothetical protein